MFSDDMRYAVTAMILIALIGGLVLMQMKRYRRMRSTQIHAAGLRQVQKDKLALATAFSAELRENKIKCESFMTIYSETLRDLRQMERKASYEQSSVFIHQQLPLMRNAFEAFQDSLSLLGTKLAGDITRLYGLIHAEAKYLTLDTALPRGDAIRHVETVLEHTQKILAPIDSIIAALNIIIRDGTKSEDEAL